MSTRHLIDPELLPLLDLFPDFELTREILPALRAGSPERLALVPPAVIDPTIEQAPGRDGAPDVPVYVYKPEGDARLRPAILHIHGGGMIMGSADTSRYGPSATALAQDAVVVSVEYRLAPETPFPGPQEDCYAALEWLFAKADRLGVDTQRVAVMGESAGGGLAAALALMARDRGEFSLCGQILTYPMLDHRTGGSDDVWRNPTVGEILWTREKNQFGWEALRGRYGLDDDRIGWFSPARAADLSGLPPALIGAGNLDLFFDENLDYARRLTAAVVNVELHVYPGAFHGFNMSPDAAIAKSCNRDLMEGTARLLAIKGQPPASR